MRVPRVKKKIVKSHCIIPKRIDGVLHFLEKVYYVKEWSTLEYGDGWFSTGWHVVRGATKSEYALFQHTKGQGIVLDSSIVDMDDSKYLKVITSRKPLSEEYVIKIRDVLKEYGICNAIVLSADNEDCYVRVSQVCKGGSCIVKIHYDPDKVSPDFLQEYYEKVKSTFNGQGYPVVVVLENVRDGVYTQVFTINPDEKSSD